MPDSPKLNGGLDPKEMQRRSVEARRRNRAAGGAAPGAAPGVAGGAAGDDKDEARAALMRILRSKNDAAVVSAAKAVLDSAADVQVDVESGLEGLTDAQLAARIAALREELATA